MKAEHKTWYNIAMRILMALMLFPLAALGTTVSELPPSGFADTEVSTVDLDLRPRSLLSHTFILKMRKLDTAWDTVKVTRRGCGAVCELVKAEGRKPGFKLEVR